MAKRIGEVRVAADRCKSCGWRALLALRPLVSPEAVCAALGAALKSEDPELIDLNRRALEAGNAAANLAALVRG